MSWVLRRGAAVVVFAASVLALSGPVPVTAGAVGTTAATGTGAPMIRVVRTPRSIGTATCPGCSYNWSGYTQVASKRRTFTEVTDSFVVPTAVTATATAGSQYAADWIGIGGWSGATLVQAGIQTVVTTSRGGTTVAYDAWTEILPQKEKRLPLVIAAGDTVTVTVQEVAKNMWSMQIVDGSQTAGRTVKYHSSGLSAEAIHERPCLRSPCSDLDHLAPLAQTSNVTFGPGAVSETRPGLTPVTGPLLGSISGAMLHYTPMVANDGVTVIATPSGPDTALDAFTVADGNVSPSPPSD